MKVNHLQRQNGSQIPLKSFSKDLFKELQILCPEGNQGELYCSQCSNQAIICAQDSCSCHQNHQSCQNFQNIKNLHRNINSKLLRNFNVEKLLQATDYISDQVLKLRNQFQDQLTYFGLNEAESEISKKIQKSCEGTKIKGQDLKKFKQKRQKQQQYKFQDSLIKFKKIVQISKINVLRFYQKLEEQIIREHIDFFQKKLLQEVMSSEIVKSKQELKTLHNLINPNLRIQGTQKIFSHQESSPMKLMDLLKACKEKSSLLFLVENKYGKKFGVFSECLLEKNTITKNENKQSCLFSINCNLIQTSDPKKILFHAAYIDSLFQGQNITFETFNDLTKRTISYLKITPEKCFYQVNGFNHFNINGISQNQQQWGSYPDIKKVQVFKIYFDKTQINPAKLNTQIQQINRDTKKGDLNQKKEENKSIFSNQTKKVEDEVQKNIKIFKSSDTKIEINQKEEQKGKNEKQETEKRIPSIFSQQGPKNIFGQVKNIFDTDDKSQPKKDQNKEINEKNNKPQLFSNTQVNTYKTKQQPSETKSLCPNTQKPVATKSYPNLFGYCKQKSNKIKSKHKLNLPGIPPILFLNEESQQMIDRRITNYVKYDTSGSIPKKIVNKTINNTIQLTETLHQDDRINCLAYSNKYGVMITCLKQQILLTDIQHLQTYLATSQTNKKSLSKISTSINFSGKIYLSPNEEKFLAVNNQDLMLFNIATQKVISKVKNEHSLRYFFFVNNQIFVGWNFLSNAYVYQNIEEQVNKNRKLEGVQKCSSINSINEHIIVCEKINQYEDDEDNKIIVYDKMARQIKNEILLKKFGNPQMYFFNLFPIVSIFPIKQEKQGQFSPNDIYGLLGYQNSDQEQPKRRFLNFMRGDLLKQNSPIQIRGLQLFSSLPYDRQIQFNSNDQEISFQVQIVTTGQVKVIMIERLQNIFYIDCSKQFQKLSLCENNSIKLQTNKYFKGVCLMKNMLQFERKPPVKDSNETCDMICKQFDGEFLSLYIEENVTKLTVPFSASLLLLGDDKIMRQYVIETQQGFEQYQADKLKNAIDNFEVQSYVQKVKIPVKIQPGKVINVHEVKQKVETKQEKKTQPQSISGLSAQFFDFSPTKRIPNIFERPNQSPKPQEPKPSLFSNAKPQQPKQIGQSGLSLFGNGPKSNKNGQMKPISIFSNANNQANTKSSPSIKGQGTSLFGNTNLFGGKTIS